MSRMAVVSDLLQWLDVTQNTAPNPRAVSKLAPSPRSGRKHKAWGASPRIEIEIERLSPRSGRQRVMVLGCRPLRGLKLFGLPLILGLAPQALCFRPLRGLGQLCEIASRARPTLR